MLSIDGSYGEGGGQVLRTSLSLAVITGQPIQIENIRAKRKNPGLAAQHLTAVRAAAAICQAQVQGDALESMALEFTPSSTALAGQYRFDVTEARQGGSAGTVSLVLQTVLLPLALATGDSHVILRGGTHIAHSPAFTYINHVYLPMLTQLGLNAQANLNAWGWYPRGGGEVELRVVGGTRLDGLTLLERGALQQVRGLAAVTQLPSHIPQRMAMRAENLLHEAQLNATVQPLRERGIGPGAGVFLTAEYEHSCAGFSAIGRLGMPSEQVAQMACEELIEFHKTGAPVDVHLADQLLLPLALAIQPSQYRVAEISLHLRTNAWVIETFGLAKITIDEAEMVVSVVPHQQ